MISFTKFSKASKESQKLFFREAPEQKACFFIFYGSGRTDVQAF